MDINFHYFAVKSLAVRAGFSPAEAQTLAEYSQLVDDYNRTGTVLFKEVPEFARHLAKKSGPYWLFHCVTTGFSSALDMAELIRPSRQRHICIPFHFIPPQALNVPVKDEAAWRTEPETLEKDTVLCGLLRKAQIRYHDAPFVRKNLISLALLLHIFADTYAHQRFSGYGGWWNHGFALKEHGHTGKKQRLLSAGMEHMGHEAIGGKHPHFSIFVGHMSFGHAPDKSWLCFTAAQKTSPKSELDLKYSRDNTEIFLRASRVILNFLRACRCLPPIKDTAWASVRNALREGFLTRETDTTRLAAHWQKHFPDITYGYSLGKVLKRSLRMPHLLVGVENKAKTGKVGDPVADDAVTGNAAEEAALEQMFSPLPTDDGMERPPRRAGAEDGVITAVGEDFFWFNVFAKEVRDVVNGEETPLEDIR